MTTDALILMVASLPKASELGNVAYWRKVVPNYIPVVVDKIVVHHDFPFTLASYATETTEAGVADYIFRGANNDLRDIISIRHGDDGTVLENLRVLDADSLVSEGATGTGVWGWYESHRDHGYPAVTIINTPTESGETLDIRYRKSGIKLADLPDEFGYVVALGVLGWIEPGYWPLFRRELKEMVRRHSVGGKDVHRAAIDPHIAATNALITDLQGGGS